MTALLAGPRRRNVVKVAWLAVQVVLIPHAANTQMVMPTATTII